MSPYVELGGSLVGLFDAGPFEAAQERIVADMADEGHDAIVRNTPVRSGNLRTSWYKSPPLGAHHRPGYYEASVVTEVEYAPYVEEGTGLYGPRHRSYEIVPKTGSALRWRDPRTGKWVWARRVTHVGSRGAHMARLGTEMVEARLDQIAEPTLQRLEREIGR